MMKTVVPMISLMLLVGAFCANACADGGQLRVRERWGDYQITVFTSPAPLRAGQVDVSILVQNAENGTAVSDAATTIELTPSDSSRAPIRVAATSDAATNKLLQAAVFELPAAGEWRVDANCKLPDGMSRAVTFTMVAAPPLPAWLTVWPWFSWPVLVILLFAMHRWLVARRENRIGQQRVHAGRCSNGTPARSYEPVLA